MCSKYLAREFPGVVGDQLRAGMIDWKCYCDQRLQRVRSTQTTTRIPVSRLVSHTLYKQQMQNITDICTA